MVLVDVAKVDVCLREESTVLVRPAIQTQTTVIH